MQPKNLRSVVAQVARGRISVVSRRNFSPSNESKEVGGTVVSAGLGRSAEPKNLRSRSVFAQLLLGRTTNVSQFVRSYTSSTALLPSVTIPPPPKKSLPQMVMAFLKALPLLVLNGVGSLLVCIGSYLLTLCVRVGTKLDSKLADWIANGILGMIVTALGITSFIGFSFKGSLGFLDKLLEKSIEKKFGNLDNLRMNVLVLWFLHIIKRKNGGGDNRNDILTGSYSLEDVYEKVGKSNEMLEKSNEKLEYY